MRKKSIVAGILIGLGVIINTMMTIPLIGPCLFAFGLLVIIDQQYYLYTGKIGYVNAETDKAALFRIFFYNFIGIVITVYLYGIANIDFLSILNAASIMKFSKTIFQMFVYGIFCGALIHFAVKCKKPYITIMAIMLFILMGAEHCIADAPYLLINFSMMNIIKYLAVVIGNSIGSIIIERLSI